MSQTQIDQDLIVRPMWPEDVPFVGSSWLHSMTEDKHVRRRRLAVVNMLINAAPIRLVACSREDPHQIYGWIVAGRAGDNDPVIHYVNVKFLYRRMGIASRLAAAALEKMGHNLKQFRFDDPDARGFLLHSHQGLRSEPNHNLTPYEHIKRRYRLSYDPHALLPNE